jgi:hypothetical protein
MVERIFWVLGLPKLNQQAFGQEYAQTLKNGALQTSSWLVTTTSKAYPMP